MFDKVAVLPSILTKRVKEEFAVWKEARQPHDDLVGVEDLRVITN